MPDQPAFRSNRPPSLRPRDETPLIGAERHARGPIPRECDEMPVGDRAVAERRLQKLIRAARLPRPVTNVKVAGWEVDVFWPASRLIVEVDGYAYHGNRAAFERDRRKDATLTAAGYTVIRITWRQITEEPLATVALLARLIRRG